MDKKLKDIVLNRQFEDLTSEERADYKEWFATEAEFEQLRNLFLGTDLFKGNSAFQPKDKTKVSLDALFDKKHGKTTPYWYNSVFTVLYPRDKAVYRRPIVQIAAALMLVLLCIPLIKRPGMQGETLAENTVQNTEQELVSRQTEIDEKVEQKTIENSGETTTVDERSQANMNSRSSNGEQEMTSGSERSMAKEAFKNSSDDALLISEMSLATGRNSDLFPEKGNFKDKEAKSVASISAGDQAEVLDLLTAIF